jgi:hypothetical protein
VSRPASGRRLLVFARNPLPGRVKTRLIPSLGAVAATAVYRQLLQDTLLTAVQVDTAICEVWLDEGGPVPWLVDIAAAHGLAIRQQSGRDLGMRMHRAFEASLRSAEHVVLIGSDCPEFDPDYLEAAFAALAEQDAVLGPAVDGGYVLIGLRAADALLFEDIAWGTPQVLQTTRDRLRRLGWRWTELPPRHDIDEPGDLQRFPRLAAIAG